MVNLQRPRKSVVRSKLLLLMPIGWLLLLPMLVGAQGTKPAVALTSLSADNSASISGFVVDQSGTPVVNARVTLIKPDMSTSNQSESDISGGYKFEHLPAGSFLVRFESSGFATFTSAETKLAEKQAYRAPEAVLLLAASKTEVEVRETESQVAAEQIRAAEKQRLFGLLPNFYVSYVPDAMALDTKQKYSLAFRDAFDPIRVLGTAFAAGIQQAHHAYQGFGNGGVGYGKRYAALYGNRLTSDLLSHAVLPSLFHQDPRYFYQGDGPVKSRLLHALSFAIMARSDTGRNVPNYSYILGNLGSGALSNLYYPHANRGVSLIFTNAAIGIAGRAGATVIKEFLLTHVTTNVPGKSKP